MYTVRAGIKTTIIASGESALERAKEIENYYGFSSPISGRDLLNKGISQAQRLGVEIISQEVVGIQETDAGFIVKTTNTGFPCKVVILATGASRVKPKWKDIEAFEGMGVSYCAVCDGFFFRGKDVAVAGSGPYALHEAQTLLPIAKSVTLCTDGKALTTEFPPEIKIAGQAVDGLEGDTALHRIKFKDGSALDVKGLFVAIGVAGSSDLANSIGAEIRDGDIVVDEYMKTNVLGLLAAGDCTGGMKQIAKSVYEGAAAGTEAVRIIRKGLKND